MLDLRFYLALFLRRLPYFLIFTVAGAAVGVALALTLPPTYEAQARLVVESEQIPDELAASTVRTEASEQLQIIEQRILTRDKLLEMANRLNIYADRRTEAGAPLRPDQIVEDLRERIRIRESKRRSRIYIAESTKKDRQRCLAIFSVRYLAGIGDQPPEIVGVRLSSELV